MEYILIQIGEKEPILNIIYRRLTSNYVEFYESFSLVDYINLFLFVFPNTIMILNFHLNDLGINFIFQNICILNLFGIFINGNIEVTFIGILNIIIMATLFSADYETYNHFSYWFDFFGIEPLENYN